MNYEFMRGSVPDVDLGFYPKFDPESDLNTEHPFALLVGTKADRVINRIVSRQGSLTQTRAVELSYDTLFWLSTEIGESDEEIIAAHPESNVGYRLRIPILEKPGRFRLIDHHEYHGEITNYPFGIEMARILFDMENKIKVRSFQTLGYHGVAILDEISKHLDEGKIVFAQPKSGGVPTFFPEEIFPHRLSENEVFKAYAKIESIEDLPPVKSIIR